MSMNRKGYTWGAALVLSAAALSYGQQSLDQILKNGVVRPTSEQRQSPEPQPAAPSPAPGWRATATRPAAAAPASGAGFRMDLPPGWQAQLSQNGAVVARAQDGDSAVVIAPVPDARGSAAEWLRTRGSAALGAYFKNAAVSAIYSSRTTPSAALASAEFAGVHGPGAAHVLYFVDGDVGTLYAVACPRQVMPQESGMLLGILRSFSFAGEQSAGGGTAPGAPAVNFTKFRDPQESAFTVDVPAGWKVQGGMLRRSTLDFRPFVYAVSPDGATTIRLGDPALGTFTEPSQLLAMAGMREGMNYSPGYGNVWPIRRYLPGPQFAQAYAAKLAGEMQAANPHFQSVRPLPQFSSNAGAAMGITVSAGEADFTCTRDGRESGGSVYAATARMGMPGGGQGAIWFHVALAGFLSPVSEAPAINDVLLHMFKSWEWNPQWVGRQSQTAVETARIAHETSEYIAKVHDEAFWNNRRVHDKAMGNWSEYMRGVVRLRDPNTGEVIEGRAGKNHYYKLRGDDLHPVGTDREIQNPDFHELEQLR